MNKQEKEAKEIIVKPWGVLDIYLTVCYHFKTEADNAATRLNILF